MAWVETLNQTITQVSLAWDHAGPFRFLIALILLLIGVICP